MSPIAEFLEAAPVVGEDTLFDRVAAAALDEFAEHGIRRTSMEDVARRAGVSRMTVFRRFASKQRLVEVVIAREVHRGMQELDLLWEGAETLEDRLVAGFEFAGRYVRGHPLFDRLLRSEPEVLLPPLTLDGGPVLELYRSLIAQSTPGRSQRRSRREHRHRRRRRSHRTPRDLTTTHPRRDHHTRRPTLRPPPSQPHTTPHAPTTTVLQLP